MYSPKEEDPSTFIGQFPVLSTNEGPVQPNEAFNVILNTPETSPLVCNQWTTGIKEAAVFLVNMNMVRHKDDLKLGASVTKESPNDFIKLNG